MEACNDVSNDFTKLNKLADTMSNPTQFAYMAGKDIIINHVNIFNDISLAIRYNEKREYKESGLYLGRALALLFLGEGHDAPQSNESEEVPS